MLYFQAMQKYELTIVLDPKATASKKKAASEMVEKVVAISKGKVGKIEDWSAKAAGIYLHFPLELTGQGAKGLLAKVAVENDIKKYLLMKAK